MATDKEQSKMNVLKMTDNEVYQLGIEALVDKLSIAGMPRFIRLCAPRTGSYAVNKHKPLELDIGTTAQKAKNEHSRNEK